MLIFKKIFSVYENLRFGTKLILFAVLFLLLYFATDSILDKKEELDKQHYEEIKNEADMKLKLFVESKATLELEVYDLKSQLKEQARTDQLIQEKQQKL